MGLGWLFRQFSPPRDRHSTPRNRQEQKRKLINQIQFRRTGKGPLTCEVAGQGAFPRSATEESACTPGSVSRVACAARGGGHPSRAAVADSLVRSTRGLGRAAFKRPRTAPEGTDLDLAPGGVYLAGRVTPVAGGLLHHRFTLTHHEKRWAVCFLWHCPAGHPGWALPTTLLCGARTFLGGSGTRRDRPAGSSAVVVIVAARAAPPAHRTGRPVPRRRGGRPPARPSLSPRRWW